jgi:hypothetical protein
VKAAISYNHDHQKDKEHPTNATTLAEDIVNCPSHILGNHIKCKPYFCKNIGSVSSTFNELSVAPAGKEVIAACHRLANRSQRLIYNITSNSAESFMAVMAKCTSGKRINFGKRGSYNRRSFSAVMAFDNGSFWHPLVFPSKTPCKIWNSSAAYYLKGRGKEKPKVKKVTKKNLEKDLNAYGICSDEGKFSHEELEEAVIRLEISLFLNPDSIKILERSTVGQAKNELWCIERRSRITASNCGRVFTFADWRDNTSILKPLLYPVDLSKIAHIKNGINREPEARELYQSITGKIVEECGLFVHSVRGYLGASPDGLIGEDGILEIKCTTISPDKIPSRPDNFLIFKNKKDPTSDIMLRRNHKYFFQVIMQMYVSGRSYCDFLVYHKPENSEDPCWFLETICRNSFTDALWGRTEEKLSKFFHHEVAPEIVNSRFHSSGKFHVPDYRKKASEEHTKKRELEKKKKEKKNNNGNEGTDETQSLEVILTESQEVVMEEELMC